MNIKFCVRLGKSATETYEKLKHVYVSGTLSRIQAIERLRRFKKGRESAKDDGSSRRLQAFRTTENIEKISAVYVKRGFKQ
ncbi:hypothetical protein TNCV_1272501 [Trichonephila clavipes]|nr:hypothetical protein TNCV_1272501 [Trichonephila clavipes]